MKVVDTSVALKWYVSETDSEIADRLIGIGLIAPDLILAEMGNALWKKVRKAELSPLQARSALNGLGAVVSLLPAAHFTPRAFEMSLELGHPIYDCFFLAAAEEYSSTVITADLRLLKTCAGTSFAPLVIDLATEGWLS
jgi:predicted nucleic acid-binding protein